MTNLKRLSRRKFLQMLALGGIAIVLEACASTPTPVPPTALATFVPQTATVIPNPTITSTPTATFTPSSTASLTPTAKPTNTPTPSPTPRPAARFTLNDDSTLVLTNGVLIDGNGGEPLRDAAVLIRNGRFVTVGTRNQVQIPTNAKIFDVQGATILPGLINAHVHYQRLSILRNWQSLQTWAAAGVTTVRDMNSSDPLSVNAVRNELLKDNKNARLVLATPMLTVPKGYPMARSGAPLSPWQIVTSVEDGVQKTNQYLDAGADVVKVAIDTGENGGGGATWPTLSLEMATAIARVAHQRGVKVTSHTAGQRDLPLVLDAGVDDIAHMAGVPVPDALVERVIKANVYWVPTLELWKRYGDTYTRAVANLTRFISAGGKVALGTDYNGDDRKDWQEGMPMIEIQGMQEAKMTPMQIIVAATKNAAFVCNLDHELGSIETGKIADVLVVNGNPLQDLRALMSIRMVIHNGAVIRDTNGQ